MAARQRLAGNRATRRWAANLPAQRATDINFAGDLTVRVDYSGWAPPSDLVFLDKLAGTGLKGTVVDQFPTVMRNRTLVPDDDRMLAIYKALKIFLDAQSIRAAPGLAAGDAIMALFHAGRHGRFAADPGAEDAFGREVLDTAGWVSRAIAAGVSALPSETKDEIAKHYRREGSSSSSESGEPDPLKEDLFRANFEKDLMALLAEHDPGKFESVEMSLDPAKAIADTIQTEARKLFAPYAGNEQGKAHHGGFAYGAKLKTPEEAPPPPALRAAYLRNRSEMLALMAQANFSGKRSGDSAIREELINTMLKKEPVQEMVDRHLNVTGRPLGVTGAMIPTRQQKKGSSKDEAERITHWERIDTLCHELMHLLCHPTFSAKAGTVSYGLVISEGFTEVLGKQLFAAVVAKATSTESFRKSLEGGVDKGAPPGVSMDLGYKPASTQAEAIRAKVGDPRFRAAYFLGAVDRVGL